MRFLHQRRNFLILRRDAHCGVDDKNTESGPADGALGTHDAENFDRAGMFAARTDAGSVDEHKALAPAPVGDVDRVARGPGKMAHDRAAIAQDGVDERRFANVRPTDDRQRKRQHCLISDL